MEKSSVYFEGEQEALRFKWIESEKAGCDLGEAAIRRWVQCHWWGYLRARWLEHLQGKRFWVELDRGDFGLLQREFVESTVLLDRILDRLKAGQENLDSICSAPPPHCRPPPPPAPPFPRPTWPVRYRAAGDASQRAAAATSSGRPQRRKGVSRRTRSCHASDAPAPQDVRIQPGARQWTRTSG